MKIVLIGFMGSGKSSVAKKLGELLHYPVVETDDLVLKKTNTKNMQELFSLGGEALLREIEITVAKEHVWQAPIIISTGGGVVLNPSILDILKQLDGKVIFFNASFETILKRLALDQSRPLFKSKEQAQALYNFRLPLYFKYADKVIDVDGKSVEEIAQEIVHYHTKG